MIQSSFDFYKYHGLGNDYIVIDPSDVSLPLKMTASNIRLLCDRNLGIGSDGILYGPVIDDEANQGMIGMRIYNPDGSEAEKSGNGIRIFAQYLMERGYVSDKSFGFFIRKGGFVNVDVVDCQTKELKVDMGEYSHNKNKIPALYDCDGAGLQDNELVDVKIHLNLGGATSSVTNSVPISHVAHPSICKEEGSDDVAFSKDLIITCVNLGNPHCVVFVDNLNDWGNEKITTYGRLIENHSMFPQRTNVQFVEVLDRNSIRIKIWERGAGLTLASGSSSVAASCAAYRKGLVDKDVNVTMQGGSLKIHIDTLAKRAYLQGRVENVMLGFFTSDLKERLNVGEVSI